MMAERVVLYQSRDGRIFSTVAEAEDHDSYLDFEDELRRLIGCDGRKIERPLNRLWKHRAALIPFLTGEGKAPEQ